MYKRLSLPCKVRSEVAWSQPIITFMIFTRLIKLIITGFIDFSNLIVADEEDDDILDSKMAWLKHHKGPLQQVMTRMKETAKKGQLTYDPIRDGFKTQPAVDRPEPAVPAGCHCSEQ